MKLLHGLEPHNFMGLEDHNFDTAQVVVLPVPYDGTTSHKSGCRDGPKAIIAASRYLETYDIELDYSPADLGIFTLEELQPHLGSVEETMKRIQETVKRIIDTGKFPLLLGGEHSITQAPVAALKEKYPDLSILQIDAHTDMRDSFFGTKFSHASVMRRCREIVDHKLVQVGIRSQSEEETEYIKKEKLQPSIFYARTFDVKKDMKNILSQLTDHVFITFDLDGLDSSILPSTGSPEPGGLCWNDAMEILRTIAKEKNVVGADVVELLPEGNFASDFTAAKVAYKLLGYAFMKKES